MKDTVVLVDGMNLVYKSAYTYSNLRTSKNVPTGALYGSLAQIFALNRFISTAYDVVLFWEGHTPDPKAGYVPSWRRELCAEYKANRGPKEGKDQEAIINAQKQVPLIIKACKILQFPQVYVPQLESDDLIGIASKSLEDLGVKVIIYSTDKDFYQCISRTVSVLRVLRGQAEVVGPKQVFQEVGVPAELFAEYKALVKDASDNYSSVKGIGPKTAAKLVNEGLRPSANWEDQASTIRKQYKSKLKADWDKVKLCYQLAYIPRSVSYQLLPKGLRVEAKEAVEKAIVKLHRKYSKEDYDQALNSWTEFCAKYELQSFLSHRRQYLARLIY